MGTDESNETELDNDDNTETTEMEKTSNRHDVFDINEEVNQSDARESHLFAPYWNAYDTVNQLYLEISKYEHYYSLSVFAIDFVDVI